MTRTFVRLKYIFLGLFLFAATGAAAYQILIVKPARACESRGGWWDADERICATPIDISTLTGRPNREGPDQEGADREGPNLDGPDLEGPDLEGPGTP